MAEIEDLDPTDASNTGRFPENQAPSTVNNGARALEGLIARFIQDTNTSVAATLSGSVIQVTANRVSISMTATTSNYRANLMQAWTMGSVPNTGPASLNIDGIGPIGLRDNRGASLSSSVLLAGTRCLAVKDDANGYFRLLWPAHDTGVSGILTTAGDIIYRNATAPARLAIGTAGQVLAANAGATAPEWQPRVTAGTALATTSGSSKTFTGIPAWVKRITVILTGVSTTGAATPVLKLGDAGGLEATGYSGITTQIAASFASAAHSTAFPLLASAGVDATVMHGTVTLVNQDGNTWVAIGTIGLSAGGTAAIVLAGSKTLSDTLTQIDIATSDAFDAGSINILYE